MARHRRLPAVTAAVLLLAAAAAPGALAQVGAEAAASQIAERYGVEVLKVQPGESDGRKVWLLTVMQPAGSGNSSFQVNHLAVDQESGALVPSFRHRTQGYDLPPAAPGAARP
jgi:hypothetical protein